MKKKAKPKNQPPVMLDSKTKRTQNSATETTDPTELSLLNRNIEKLAIYFGKANIADYINFVGKPKVFFVNNFIGGLLRGLGFGIGFTVLGAIAFFALKALVDVPLIGDFIAKIVSYVEQMRAIRP